MDRDEKRGRNPLVIILRRTSESDPSWEVVPLLNTPIVKRVGRPSISSHIVTKPQPLKKNIDSVSWKKFDCSRNLSKKFNEETKSATPSTKSKAKINNTGAFEFFKNWKIPKVIGPARVKEEISIVPKTEPAKEEGFCIVDVKHVSLPEPELNQDDSDDSDDEGRLVIDEDFQEAPEVPEAGIQTKDPFIAGSPSALPATPSRPESHLDFNQEEFEREFDRLFKEFEERISKEKEGS